jgi:glycosyltransferase involved in cell wall biosynthesis
LISILIPVYNYEIAEMAGALHALQSDFPFEIIFAEDGSDEKFINTNQKTMHSYPEMKHWISTQNKGRAAIRNQLARMASFDYLLFLDADTIPFDSEFIHRYEKVLKENILIYGGRSYTSDSPKERNKFLHWKYGKTREVIPLVKRRKFPYRSFMTNNFLIPKSLFNSIGGFDEEIQSYGHEDTIFGMLLRQNQIEILHIENAAIHMGIEEDQIFIKKSLKAAENLIFLSKKYPELAEEVKIWKYFIQTKKLGLVYLLGFIFKIGKPIMEYFIKNKRANLFCFDLYRLSFLHWKSLGR